jgi:hypothetical protein
MPQMWARIFMNTLDQGQITCKSKFFEACIFEFLSKF